MRSEGDAPRRFVVEPDESGLRLDHFLTARCEDLSRNRVQRAIDDEGATVDGRVRPSRYRVEAGQVVLFTPPVPPPSTAEPEDIPLDVVFRDDHVMVVNKPAGLVVHPAPGHPDGTLVNALLFHVRDLPGGDRLRPGLVHRLDKDTSGLLVVALDESTLNALQDQLRDRSLGRLYEALSWGQWAEDEGELRGAVGRHPHLRQRMAVLESGGREAITHYEVREDFGFVQRCEARLRTGRTHQIRVHFSHHNHPVVGDPLYGDDARLKGVHPLDRPAALAMCDAAGRQMLHARELSFTHPVTGEALAFTAEPPADFTAALTALRDAAPSS